MYYRYYCSFQLTYLLLLLMSLNCLLKVGYTFSPLFFFVLTDIWIVHASYRSSYAPLENRLYFYPSSQVEFVSQFSTDSTYNFSGSFFCASFRMSFHFSSKSTDTGNDAGVFFLSFKPDGTIPCCKLLKKTISVMLVS